MTLTPLAELLPIARDGGYGLGAFNVVTLEHAEAITAGAEDAESPVVLQISQNCVKYHGSLEPIASATLAVAARAAIPVAVHLDHAEDPTLVREAIGLGIGSVMFDASTLDYDDNVAATAEIVGSCHRNGVVVEAELGEVGGKDGVHAPGARTGPAEAAAFARATGVDALAVAVGTSHAMRTRDAVVDHHLVARLREAVPVPLVLHGSSGVSDEELERTVASGITKVNIATHLNAVFTTAIRTSLNDDPGVVDPRRYMTVARDAVAAESARLLRVLRAVR